MQRTKSKLETVKVSRTQGKKSVPTLKDLFEADRQARLEIAMEYDQHGEGARCMYHPLENTGIGLGNTNDRLLLLAINAAKKHPESVRFTVEQAVLFRSDEDNDSNGHLFLK